MIKGKWAVVVFVKCSKCEVKSSLEMYRHQRAEQKNDDSKDRKKIKELSRALFPGGKEVIKILLNRFLPHFFSPPDMKSAGTS